MIRSYFFLQVFAFIVMLLYISALVYFVLIKLVTKRHTHGAALALDSGEDQLTSGDN